MPSPQDLIRHIRYPEQVKRGKVHKRAFRPDAGDHGLSVTACLNEISVEAHVDAYQAFLEEETGLKLGICYVTVGQVHAMHLTLTDDPLDRQYGHLHKLIQNPKEADKCPTDDERELLARYATENGHIREAS